jgi:hypothetical protein
MHAGSFVPYARRALGESGSDGEPPSSYRTRRGGHGQRFLGVSYYECGFYWQRDGVRLHRVVFEHFHGDIPEGWQVHHRDEDRSNNHPGNLALLHGSEHARLHSIQPQRAAFARENIKNAIAAAPAWHASAEGLEWHKQHWRNHMAAKFKQVVTKSCQTCGQPYEVVSISQGKSKFCGLNCKMRALRERRAAAAGRVLPEYAKWDVGNGRRNRE